MIVRTPSVLTTSDVELTDDGREKKMRSKDEKQL